MYIYCIIFPDCFASSVLIKDLAWKFSKRAICGNVTLLYRRCSIITAIHMRISVSGCAKRVRNARHRVTSPLQKAVLPRITNGDSKSLLRARDATPRRRILHRDATWCDIRSPSGGKFAISMSASPFITTNRGVKFYYHAGAPSIATRVRESSRTWRFDEHGHQQNRILAANWDAPK